MKTKKIEEKQCRCKENPNFQWKVGDGKLRHYEIQFCQICNEETGWRRILVNLNAKWHHEFDLQGKIRHRSRPTEEGEVELLLSAEEYHAHVKLKTKQRDQQ